LELRTPVWKTNYFKVPQSVILIFCFTLINPTYLGRCLRDCPVKIAENSFLEAATGLLRPCTMYNVHRRTLLAVAERFAGVGCSLITSLFLVN
jgi:hypothetical protein